MSIQHREDSIRDMKLERLGVTPPQDWNDVEQVRTAKKAEIGLACSAAIYAGIDVGGAHYSLTEHDQTELMAQFQTVKEGAEEVPYHADGELCRMYTAEEFTALTQAATAHVFYHRTYCNHLNAWIKRAGLDEIPGYKFRFSDCCDQNIRRAAKRCKPLGTGMGYGYRAVFVEEQMRRRQTDDL